MSHTHSDPCQNIESVTGRRGKKLNPVKTIKKNKKEIVITKNHKKWQNQQVKWQNQKYLSSRIDGRMVSTVVNTVDLYLGNGLVVGVVDFEVFQDHNWL